MFLIADAGEVARQFQARVLTTRQKFDCPLPQIRHDGLGWLQGQIDAPDDIKTPFRDDIDGMFGRQRLDDALCALLAVFDDEE